VEDYGMSVRTYLTSEEEKEVLNTFRALHSEWGLERVTMFLPASWQGLQDPKQPITFKHEYCTLHSIIIQVLGEDDQVAVCWVKDLL
jgi:hypothetical protein